MVQSLRVWTCLSILVSLDILSLKFASLAVCTILKNTDVIAPGRVWCNFNKNTNVLFMQIKPLLQHALIFTSRDQFWDKNNFKYDP